MKKKVLYGVALALASSVAMGTLQSCKDDLSDFEHKYSYDQDLLKKRVSDLETAVAACKENCAKEIEALKTRITKNEGDIADMKAELQRLAGMFKDWVTLDELQKQLATLKTECNNYTDQQVANAVSGIRTEISTLKTDLQKEISDLNTALSASISELSDKVNANESAIAAINTTLETYDKAIREINGNLSLLEAQVLGHTEEIEGLRLQYEALGEEINLLYQEMAQDRENVAMMYNALMLEIQNKFDELCNRMNNVISSILIQSVNSPVFGDFSLPIGVKSNILFNWYGYNVQNKSFQFPNNVEGLSATGAPGLNLASVKEYETIPEGAFPQNVTLGTVYVSLNPLGNQYDGTPLQVVNSKGEALPFEVKLKGSDKLLTHLYSRAEIDQYLYEGEAILNTDDNANIDKVAIRIDEGLKTAMKEALKDRTKRSAVALMKALYNQMSGMLPAYALQVGYNLENSDTEFSGNAYKVLSQYDLAVATARPLSYNFLADVSISHRLPTLGHLDNLILKLKDDENLHFDFGEPFTVEGFTVDLGSINFENVNDNLVITIPNVVVSDGDGGWTVDNIVVSTENGDIEGMEDLISSIESAIKEALAQSSEDLNGKIANMVNSINESVENMFKQLNDVNGQIDNMIDDIADKFQPYFDKANRAFDLYNKIANKVNNFLADPNAYLQVTALYSMNGNYGFVSGKASDPTIFNKAGGNAIGIYLTSYTGELIVPAYKKFVACTGATKNGQNVDFSAVNTGDLGKVLDGNRIHVAVPAANLQSGVVYEFTYQAVDYSGFTSTKKFYIEVK